MGGSAPCLPDCCARMATPGLEGRVKSEEGSVALAEASLAQLAAGLKLEIQAAGVCRPPLDDCMPCPWPSAVCNAFLISSLAADPTMMCGWPGCVFPARRSVALEVSLGGPPRDYHECAHEYGMKNAHGLLHSLCAWWAQGSHLFCKCVPGHARLSWCSEMPCILPLTRMVSAHHPQCALCRNCVQTSDLLRPPQISSDLLHGVAVQTGQQPCPVPAVRWRSLSGQRAVAGLFGPVRNKTWTAIQHYGPDHLGVWLNGPTHLRCDEHSSTPCLHPRRQPHVMHAPHSDL